MSRSICMRRWTRIIYKINVTDNILSVTVWVYLGTTVKNEVVDWDDILEDDGTHFTEDG